MRAYIFVSYSRHDAQVVSQLVRLLRSAIAGVPSVTGREWQFVFQDTDHIPVGSNWEEQIDLAITSAGRMFVFWCEHSASSAQVRREYELGVKSNIVVAPVLVDDTPLPDVLSRINGIDLRELRIHGPYRRRAFPRPGERSPERILSEGFSTALGVDPNAMLTNLHGHELGKLLECGGFR
ncbi:MAG: toll/interleukin-1 receptor domain-containing protein [Vicinamibacterales bacterium]